MTFKNDNPHGHGHGRIYVPINKPYQTRPVITGTKKIGGVKHYTGPGGKVYVASVVDKIFGK